MLKNNPLWSIGFRPFFLGAAFWAAASILIWLGLVDFNWSFKLNGLAPMIWHAHEMIFGYALAVIAGFLLTAVPNWTNSPPVNGWLLFTIFSCWLLARLSSLFGGEAGLSITGFLDLAFLCGLFIAIATPIFKRRQFRQAGILVKILLMATANLLFYLGAAGILENGTHYGLYAAFYLIIALILTLARRVFPMFITNGVGLKKPLTNRRWVDISSLAVFSVFWVLEIFQFSATATSWVALLLMLIHSMRLFDWYAPGMWQKPLVWVLYVSYVFMVLGFGLKASSLIGIYVSPILSLHLFAIGGIGMVTCGMISRVSLGHSGRNIHNPSPWLTAIFICLVAATIVRVVFPLVAMQHYLLWMSLSKVFWIAGFAGFLIIYTPMLTKPRVDQPD